MRSQAEKMRVVRISQQAFEDLATRGGAYVVWHDPDERDTYTPTIYLGSLGVPWSVIVVDAFAIAAAILAGVLIGVALS